ncbi:MAG: PQQ-binding-like beta-propeller repeat protein, partial [Pseudomonadota bacterium]
RTGITIKDWGSEQKAYGFFADILARVYAVDLSNGELVWSKKVDDHHNATTTAQPVLFEDYLFQPVSSLEVVPAADPNYACCTFRGSIVTMDINDGSILRQTFTIPEEPKQVGTNNVGVPKLAPSGAPVWNTPTVDQKKRRLYFGTGENYSSPADGNSDAIIAMNIDDGSIAWVTQTTPRDAWNVACMPIIENQTNCPQEDGPDVDFGAPPILIEDGDKRILVAGQKSGVIWGIAPEDGEILWKNPVGRGGVQGGMHFGMASDGQLVYVPISDFDDDELPIEDARPGMYALNAFTGELVWSSPADNVCGDKVDCDPGISAAISAIDGAAFAGHMDGRLRAYAEKDGRVLWNFDTTKTFVSVSGREASGGSFGGGTAPVVHNGRLFANSGYGLYFHMPGNVLIAFEPD